MATTLLLDRAAWDIVLDASGNIAVASEPYSLAQDVASACRTFLGEVYYDTTLGVPYWNSILGKTPPPISFMQEQFVIAAKTVPNVKNAVCVISGFNNRGVTGQVTFTDAAGNTNTVNIG